VSRWKQPLAYLLFVGVLAALFAQVEIQVEGAAGWAGNLPTWRKTPEEWPILKLLWGGRPMTGYHFYVFPFMALIFHLPILFSWRWSVSLEARCLASVMMFWIVEDILWFAMNPAFGLGNFKEGAVAWHPHWILGLPVDYWEFGLGGLGLFVFSFRRELFGPRREKERSPR
jgi:hypothetical protein